ncbi:MAG: hypothetical protein AB1635_18505 [Acidobacteriota bacterium]
MGVIGQGLVALLLFAAGGAFYAAGAREQAIADVERALVTLRYDEALAARAAAGDASWLARAAGALGLDAGSLDASLAYWTRDYSTIDAQAEPLLAANAAYHEIRRQGGDWKTVVTRLDEVVKLYGTILRDDPGNAEAAYNFEYTARLRAIIAAARQPMRPAGPEADLITLHGDPGAPPRGTDMKQFKMIVPMQPNERQEAEQAGRAGVRQRKG